MTGARSFKPKEKQHFAFGPLAAACLAASLAAGCEEVLDTTPAFSDRVVAGGDPEEGRRLIASGEFGCQACHSIGSIGRARGIVGPSLDTFGDRVFIAGTVPNRPGVLVEFLLNPPAFAPNTAMPVTGLDREQATHIAAFLYTLRGRQNGGR